MLLILGVFYFFHSTISAAPVSHILRDDVTSDLNSTSSQCICPSQQRSLWDILWSCLGTIFACTWVSVHPNIPPRGERWWKTGLRRLEIMLWALIAPELMILWAMRQWFGARGIVNKYHGHGWTKTHAYFIQMGGFTLFEGGKPIEVLLATEMDRLLLNGRIDLPSITEEEIRDRSKGDGLSKALVIGQTSWFVAQCISRHAQGLMVTELELVTASFAMLNGVMYFLWWNKPLDVRCSVPVHLLDKAKPKEERFKFNSTTESSITHSPWGAIFCLTSTIYHKSVKVLTCPVAWISKFKNFNLNTSQKALAAIIATPWHAYTAFFSRLNDIATFFDFPLTLEVTGCVPTVSTFHSDAECYTTVTTNMLLAPSVTSTIGVLFGGLHCVGWFFIFPSHTELVIWRVCTAIISTVPLAMLFGVVLAFVWKKMESRPKVFPESPITPLMPFVIALPIIYAVARLLLLGEAFAALRYLPPDALAVVNWLSFLPHI